MQNSLQVFTENQFENGKELRVLPTRRVCESKAPDMFKAEGAGASETF